MQLHMQRWVQHISPAGWAASNSWRDQDPGAYRMCSDSPAGQRGVASPWTMMQCVGVQGKARGSSMLSVMNRPARMQGSAMRQPLRPCQQVWCQNSLMSKQFLWCRP